MLVLNTNQSGQLGRKSNSFLGGSYPDFDQILIKPDSGFGDETKATTRNDPQEGKDYFSVNGTKINYGCGNMFEPFYQGISGQKFGRGGSFSMGRNSQTKMRVGLLQPLPAGKVIGKLIIATFNALIYNQTSRNITLEILVQLLHKNGSLTDVGTVTTTCVSIGGPYQEWGEYAGEIGTSKNAGVVSQEGDLVVATITAKSTNTSYESGFSFGREGFDAKPIQISID